MGPIPITIIQLQKVFVHEPDKVTWSELREVILHKGESGKLGIKLQTFQGKIKTYTVLTKIKDECKIQKGILNVFDRIVFINFKDVTDKSGQKVLNIISSLSGPIYLQVCQAEGILTTRNKINKCFVANFSSHDPGSGIASSQPSGVVTESLTVDSKEVFFNKDCEPVCLRKKCNKNNLENSVNESVIDTEHAVDILIPESDDCGESNSRNIKRGHSEVSGCSSTQSASSDPFLRRDERMRRFKENDKPSYRSGAPNIAVLEPLHPGCLLPTQQQPLTPVGRSGNVVLEDTSRIQPVVKDATLSIQDIVFEDQMPSPGYANPYPCNTCLAAAEATVCMSCGRKTGSSPRKVVVGSGVSLFVETKESLPEDYGNFLLKNPHLALWDGKNTHVVEIDKSNGKDFGFDFKVKVGKNQDASVEVYTLVKNVAPKGPACGKLRVGDWIRSVNGTPIQNLPEAFSLVSSENEVKTLRLVIQRPVGFMHPSSVRSDKSQNYSNITKPISPLPLQISPQGVKEWDSLVIPGIIEPKNNPDAKFQPSNFTDVSRTDNDFSSVNMPLPKNVKFPKVRIFMCGSEAEKCSQFIFCDSNVNIVFKQAGYAYSEFSMTTDCCGNVVLSKVCSNLYAVSSQASSYSAPVSQVNSKGYGDSHCCHCSSDYTTNISQNIISNVVNVELFVITDDKLFHNCCNYLFTKFSMFILTFDGAKLLCRASTEFARLQNLSHTIRSFAGDDCHVMSCGLLNEVENNSTMLDEVQALFYTHFNTQLQNYNVCGPELVNLQAVSQGGSTVNQNLQVVLWKTITDSVQRQQVLHPSLWMVDYLHNIRHKEMFLTEEHLMTVIRQKMPEYQLDVRQMILQELIMFGEIILGKAAPYFIQSRYAIETAVVVDPKLLLDRLYNVIVVITEDKQNWSRTHATGLIKASELASLSNDSDVHWRFIIEFLECYNLILLKPKLQQGSGNDYFIPYFAQLPSACDIPTLGKKDLVLFLHFNYHESTRTFLQLMFSMASECDNPDSFHIHGINCCSIQHRGVHIIAHHQKVEDKVKLIIRREDTSSVIKPPDVYKWLQSVCSKYLEASFVLGCSCPLGENCHRDPTSGNHQIDLRYTKPEYCGKETVDTMLAIHKWRPRDLETSEKVKLPVGIMDLNWTTFHKICQKLKLENVLGRDWRGLAGLMKYTAEQVQMYELSSDPVKQLLCDWSATHAGTIKQFISLLGELQREDVISDICQSLSDSKNIAANNSYDMRLNNLDCDLEEHTKGSITVAERGVASENESISLESTFEEGAVSNKSLGLKMNIDINLQVDTGMTGLVASTSSITPVETPPLRLDPLSQS